MILSRALLQDMMQPTTEQVDTIRDLLNSRLIHFAGMGVAEIKLSMYNIHCLNADLENMVPVDKVGAATSIVLAEYVANSISVDLLIRGQTEPFDPTTDLSDREMIVCISWGPNVQIPTTQREDEA